MAAVLMLGFCEVALVAGGGAADVQLDRVPLLSSFTESSRGSSVLSGRARGTSEVAWETELSSPWVAPAIRFCFAAGLEVSSASTSFLFRLFSFLLSAAIWSSVMCFCAGAFSVLATEAAGAGDVSSILEAEVTGSRAGV